MKEQTFKVTVDIRKTGYVHSDSIQDMVAHYLPGSSVEVADIQTKPVTVTQLDSGVFECVEESASGSPTIGRGSSVLEAVGDWAIQTGTVQSLMCHPPALLREFRVATPYPDLEFVRAATHD